MVHVRALAFVTACAVLLGSLTFGAAAWPMPTAAAMRIGRSVGSPTTGHLIGGSHLDETPYLRVVPFYAYNDARWGLGPLVGMIDR
ncbi:MAG TPA: hypothetical protein VNO21_12280, partial [Polyangiaceae bacterium]|nr:hypothetical protein [Polyangiaceae bacterium]